VRIELNCFGLLQEMSNRKYHGPKDYLDAAKSLETSAEELKYLAKSEYDFVKTAVARNPNSSEEVLELLLPTNLESWTQQELASAIAGNIITSPQTLKDLANDLIPFLNNGRGNNMAFEAGINLCCNSNTPIEAIQTVLTSEKTATQFRKSVAGKTNRRDVLNFLITDRSEAVKKRVLSRIELK
jgi:hypothetical protein